MSLRLSANAAPSTWRDAKDLIIKRIENSWINYGSEDRDRIFITTTSLKGIWRDPAELDSDPFSYLSPILATSFDQFCRTSICLVSALVHYGWDPNFATDRLEVGGLWIDSLQRLLTDNDIPLNTPDFETIFGGRKVAFIDGQLMFKPGVLEDNHHGFCRLQPGTRLPFRYLQNENPRSGFYGEVTKVEVLRGYFRLPDSRRQNKEFACKTFTHSRGNFMHEVKHLVLLNRNAASNHHIVTHILPIEIIGRTFHVLFPWAWTDLRDFFKRSPDTYPRWLKREAVTPRNMMIEVGNLALALDHLHERVRLKPFNEHVPMYHMDFKPDNILVFQPETVNDMYLHPLGLWKITDFGASALGRPALADVIHHAQSTNTSSQTAAREPQSTTASSQTAVREPRTTYVSTSADRPLQREYGVYQGPEVEGIHQFHRQNIDHARADIFSYGCVLTELLAFCMEGPSSLRRLQQALAHDDLDCDQRYRGSYFYHFVPESGYVLAPELDHFFRSVATSDRMWHLSIWKLIQAKALCPDPSERIAALAFSESLAECTRTIPNDSVFLSSNLTLPEPLSRPSRSLTYSVSAANSVSVANSESSDHSSNVAHRDSRLRFGRSLTRSASAANSVYSDHTNGSQRSANSFRSDNSDAQLAAPARGLSARGNHFSPPFASLRSAGFRSTSFPDQRPVGVPNIETGLPSRRGGSGHSSNIGSSPAESVPNSLRTARSTESAEEPSLHYQGDDFVHHLLSSHFESNMVFVSANGRAAVFSDGQKLCRARFSDSMSFECMSSIYRNPSKNIDATSIKLSESIIAVRESINSLSFHMTGIPGPFVKRRCLEEKISSRNILQFNISATGCVAIEFPKTIEVFDLDAECVLTHEKHNEGTFGDLTFNSNGSSLYAICRNSFYQWRSSEGENVYERVRNFTHETVSPLAEFRLKIVPVGCQTIVLLQNQRTSTDIRVVKDSMIETIYYDSPKHKIVGKLCSTPQGHRICCLGQSKNLFKTKYVLLESLVQEPEGGDLALEFRSVHEVHISPVMGQVTPNNVVWRSNDEKFFLIEAIGTVTEFAYT